MSLRTKGNLQPGEDEKEAKDDRNPRDLHQHGSECNEEAAEDQGSQNSIKEDAVAEPVGDRKEVENDEKNKKVVDGEAFLHEIAGEKFQTALPGELVGVISQQPGILWKPPKAVGIESRAEQEGQRNPDNDIENCLAMGQGMFLAPPPPHVKNEAREYQQAEKSVKPPILGKGMRKT